MTPNGNHHGSDPVPSSEGPPADTTFDYEVRFEWGANTHRTKMNRVGSIVHFVAERLAEIGIEDADERPQPDIARITIERIAAAPQALPTTEASPTPEASPTTEASPTPAQ